MHTNSDPWDPQDGQELWKNLAHSTELPHQIMADIWNAGNRSAQRILARRTDLDDTITDTIVGGSDVDLLCEWLRTERPREQLAHVPLHNVDLDEETSERISHHIAWQPRLDSAQLEHVIATARADTAQVLLARPDLTGEQRRRIAIAAITAEDNQSSSTGRRSTLIASIGYDPETWTALTEHAGVSMFPTLSEVVLTINDRTLHRTIADHVVTSLTNSVDPSRARDIIRLVRVLLRSPHVDPAVYRKLLHHPLLGEIRGQLEERATIDVSALLTELGDCDPARGCANLDHLKALTTLDQVSPDIPQSSDTVLGSALAHRDDLDERTYLSIVGREPLSERIHRQLVAARRTDLLADLVSSQGRRGGLLANPTADILTVLAERGDDIAFDYAHTERNRATIAEHFAPVSSVLEEPSLAAHTARRLAVLDTSHRDTVYRLLPEWVGDLESLIRTARDL